VRELRQKMLELEYEEAGKVHREEERRKRMENRKVD